METQSATSGTLAKVEIKPESDDNLDSCRLCMERNSDMRDLFAVEHDDFVKMIDYCTGLKLMKQEGIPSHICEPCINNLKVAHTFKETCLASDEKYQKHIQASPIEVKVENVDIEFDNSSDDIGGYDDFMEDDSDCKDILKEVLKLTDIKVSKVKLIKKEIERPEPKTNRKNRQPKPIPIKLKEKIRAYKRQKQSTPAMLKDEILAYNFNAYKKPPGVKKKIKAPIKFKCTICNIEFKNREESIEHKKDKHSEKVTVICEICGKVLSSRASLHTHTASHLPPRHACDICDYKTWHKHDLAKHKRIHTGIKMYQCEFCTASFHTSSNLRGHIRIHHEGAPKRFSCKQCERSFHSGSKLSRHQDTHNDIKRYACEVCHSCFARRCYWKKHMDRQHGVSVPPKRPGRQKTNILVGETKPDLITEPSKEITMSEATEISVE